MLIDTTEISVKGGHGGRGVVSFGKMMGSGPNGGNGGDGGNVYIRAVSDITLLNQFSQKKSFSAENGGAGEKNKKTGSDGKDLEIVLPVGTTLIDKTTRQPLFELMQAGERKLVALGGKGGKGNFMFRSPRKTTPKYAQPGLIGEEKKLILTLRLIADYGLIGLPNAGKSSLLNELTNANAKIANYPFTTLSPNLGVHKGKVFADIPGLIEGASEGKGLGVRFLKHIEKVGTLIHCISSESDNPLKDYKTVREEMGKFNKELLTKPEIIVITKSDLADNKTLAGLVKKFASKSAKVLSTSIHDWASLKNLEKVFTA